MRQTSIEVYNKINESGLLSRARFKVFAAIVTNEPCSASDILKYYEERDHKVSYSTVTARFSELEKIGVIRNTGKTKLNDKGNNCIIWEISGNLPIKYLPKKKGAQPINTISNLAPNTKILIWLPLCKEWQNVYPMHIDLYRTATHWMHQPKEPKQK